jgi:hypothetical protein
MALCGRRFIIARLMRQLPELLSSTHCAHTTSRAAWGRFRQVPHPRRSTERNDCFSSAEAVLQALGNGRNGARKSHSWRKG